MTDLDRRRTSALDERHPPQARVCRPALLRKRRQDCSSVQEVLVIIMQSGLSDGDAEPERNVARNLFTFILTDYHSASAINDGVGADTDIPPKHTESFSKRNEAKVSEEKEAAYAAGGARSGSKLIFPGKFSDPLRKVELGRNHSIGCEIKQCHLPTMGPDPRRRRT